MCDAVKGLLRDGVMNHTTTTTYTNFITYKRTSALNKNGNVDLK